ncbi:MAG: MATE family efflux transporter [Bacillota bacterium]|nr:MATE family efflux transporter [Bacillota bacterium]
MENKKYYSRALKVAWPSVLESFFIALAAMIDTMMVGKLGPYAIAAIGLTTQPKFIGFIAFIAINISVSALVARRRGQEDKKGANEVFLTAITIAIILVILVSIVSVSLADPLMRFSGSKEDTHLYAVEYFRIIMGGIVFNVVAMTINAAQRGSGNTKIAFVTNLVSSVINIIFNYLLIGGNFGFPALGVRGAAIATVFGSFVAMIMAIRSLFNPSSLIDIKYIIDSKIKMSFKTFKSIFQLSFNIFFENLAMRVGFLITAITAAGLGTRAFAVHNAGMNILSLGFSFADGMQVAAVALTGRALGEGKKDLAIIYGHVCQKIGFGISILFSLIMFIFGKNIMGLYFKEPEIIADGLIITRFMMVIVLLQISQIIYGGCLRSGGDVRYTLVVGIIAVTIIRSAVTLATVNVFELGLYGIWIGILSDQLTRFVLLRHRFKQGKWTEIKI